MPESSDKIAPRYLELSLVETITPSIRSYDKFFVVSNTCFVDSNNNDSIGNSSFVNFVFPYPTTATFFNQIPPKML